MPGDDRVIWTGGTSASIGSFTAVYSFMITRYRANSHSGDILYALAEERRSLFRGREVPERTPTPWHCLVFSLINLLSVALSEFKNTFALATSSCSYSLFLLFIFSAIFVRIFSFPYLMPKYFCFVCIRLLIRPCVFSSNFLVGFPFSDLFVFLDPIPVSSESLFFHLYL